jgi:hypothetical protein
MQFVMRLFSTVENKYKSTSTMFVRNAANLLILFSDIMIEFLGIFPACRIHS